MDACWDWSVRFILTFPTDLGYRDFRSLNLTSIVRFSMLAPILRFAPFRDFHLSTGMWLLVLEMPSSRVGLFSGSEIMAIRSSKMCGFLTSTTEPKSPRQ